MRIELDSKVTLKIEVTEAALKYIKHVANEPAEADERRCKRLKCSFPGVK